GGNLMYIMDTDTFVHAYRLNYPFDLFPSYWDKIAMLTQQHQICINTSIYNELTGETEKKLKDDLQIWIENEFRGKIYDKDQDTVDLWGDIINHVKRSDHYKSDAFYEWAKEEVADPWIIATAKAKNLTVVTNEDRKSTRLNSSHVSIS